MFSLTDLHRILFGEAAPWFLLEVCLRASITYVGVVGIMRLLGARVAGQFTLFEMSVTVVIAAAIGVPLQSADRGLLPAMLLVLTMVALQRVIAEVGMRRRRFQTTISGDVALLLADGRLCLDALRHHALPRETIYSQIRARGITQLGEIARIYIEPSGAFTVVPARTARAGLAVVPQADKALLDAMPVRGTVCAECGDLREESGNQRCASCGASEHAPARLAPVELP